jgi:RHS repeat-associated protein
MALAALGAQARSVENASLEKLHFISIDCARVWMVQAVDLHQENAFIYGESVSEPTHYNYFRSYDSRTGRYTQVDPIGLRGGWNGFSYSNQNPLIFTDPTGLNPLLGLLALGELVLLADSIANGPVPLPVAGRLAGGAGSAASSTTLYRAVMPEELACINSSGMFRNLGSAEGKYFTTSAEEAAFYAQQAVNRFRDPPYTIVQTVVPNSTLNGLLPATVDRGITAWVIPNNRLPGMTPNVLNQSPIPRR